MDSSTRLAFYFYLVSLTVVGILASQLGYLTGILVIVFLVLLYLLLKEDNLSATRKTLVVLYSLTVIAISFLLQTIP